MLLRLSKRNNCRGSISDNDVGMLDCGTEFPVPTKFIKDEDYVSCPAQAHLYMIPWLGERLYMKAVLAMGAEAVKSEPEIPGTVPKEELINSSDSTPADSTLELSN